MNYDVALVYEMCNKANCSRIAPYIKEHAVSSVVWDVVKVIQRYYKDFPSHDSVDFDALATYLRTVTSIKADKMMMVEKLLALVKGYEKVEDEVLENVLRNFIRKDYATQILHKCTDVLQDKATIEDVHAIIQEHDREMGSAVSDDDLFVKPDLSYIVDATKHGGLKWRLNELNLALGPLRQGDFIILAARPETGKTTFVASEISNFLKQIDGTRPVMWINNEERSIKVMSRVIQSCFGVPWETLEGDIPHYEKAFNTMHNGNMLKILDDDTGMNAVKKLTGLFELHNPCLIVFDQLDKVAGFTRSEREDLRLGSLYQWARELAKKYGPVIAVSQASESAEHATYITMDMLRGSKTDKAGEADAIITIGKPALDDPDQYKRYLHFPKNKLAGDTGSMETYRHAKFEVKIVPELARYEGAH